MQAWVRIGENVIFVGDEEGIMNVWDRGYLFELSA